MPNSYVNIYTKIADQVQWCLHCIIQYVHFDENIATPYYKYNDNIYTNVAEKVQLCLHCRNTDVWPTYANIYATTIYTPNDYINEEETSYRGEAD